MCWITFNRAPLVRKSSQSWGVNPPADTQGVSSSPTQEPSAFLSRMLFRICTPDRGSLSYFQSLYISTYEVTAIMVRSAPHI